jgi:hypothetical protein
VNCVAYLSWATHIRKKTDGHVLARVLGLTLRSTHVPSAFLLDYRLSGSDGVREVVCALLHLRSTIEFTVAPMINVTATLEIAPEPVKVLVAEDEVPVRFMVAEVLREAGFRSRPDRNAFASATLAARAGTSAFATKKGMMAAPARSPARGEVNSCYTNRGHEADDRDEGQSTVNHGSPPSRDAAIIAATA